MPKVSGFVYDSTNTPVSGRTVRVYRRDNGALLGSATTSAGPAAAGDEHYNLTSLALLCNGTDGSTTITDSSVSPKTVTASGNAQIDTAQSAFGGASLLFDGTSDFCSVPHSSAFDFGSGDFTIGLWLRPSGTSGVLNLMRKSVTSGVAPFSLLIDAGRLRTRHSTNGTTYAVDLTGTIVLSTSTFTYCEVVRDSGTIRIFVAGVPDGTAAISGALMTNSSAVYIGAQSDGANGYGGHMDDIVIWNGVAKHTADFSGSLPGAYIPALPVLDLGGYSINTAGYSAEVNVVALDDAAGDVENDLILRTTPV